MILVPLYTNLNIYIETTRTNKIKCYIPPVPQSSAGFLAAVPKLLASLSLKENQAVSKQGHSFQNLLSLQVSSYESVSFPVLLGFYLLICKNLICPHADQKNGLVDCAQCWIYPPTHQGKLLRSQPEFTALLQ